MAEQSNELEIQYAELMQRAATMPGVMEVMQTFQRCNEMMAQFTVANGAAMAVDLATRNIHSTHAQS